MEKTTTKSPIMIYTEQTPNPETLKYVTNKILFRGTADFREELLANEWSPFASFLFDIPYVKGVFVSNNFVTVTKEFNYSWEDVKLQLKEEIKKYISESSNIFIKDGFKEAMQKISEEKGAAYNYTNEEAEIVVKIKDLIETYVKPAVESDGGNIQFKKFDNGIVTVILQGACSGCPSSTVTLKSGIENMLKMMVPQVTEVVSEFG